MEPAIGRSLTQGFRIAKNSGPGIGVYAGSWMIIGLAAFLLLAMAGMPPELAERPAAPSAPAAPPAAAPPEAAVPAAPSPTAESGNLFTDLNDTVDHSAAHDPAPVAAASAAGVEETPDTNAEETMRLLAERNRIVGDWLRTAWPVLSVLILLVLGAGLMLSGGQIGYMAHSLRTGQYQVKEFFRAGLRSLPALFAATGIWVAAVAGLLLAVVAGLLLLRPVLKALPGVLIGLIGTLVAVACLALAIWISVRLSFWFIAVAADGLGPMAAARASFKATQGRWWRLLGFGLLAGIISSATWIPFRVLEWIGKTVGGPGGNALDLLSNLLGLAASLYIGFALLAAYIHYYDDAKGAASS